MLARNAHDAELSTEIPNQYFNDVMEFSTGISQQVTSNNTNYPDTALLQQSETFRVVHINQVLMQTIQYPGYKNIIKTKNLQIIP